MWDLATSKSKKICVPKKALSTQSLEKLSASGTAVGELELVAIFVSDAMLAVSFGPLVLLFDLNKDQVVIQSAECELDLEAGDVNAMEMISSSSASASATILCSCDDGVVQVEIQKIEELSGGGLKLAKKSHWDEHPGALVSCAKPMMLGADNLHVVSGGYDCKVTCSRGESERVVFDLSTPEIKSGNVKQMFNPPYVHALQVIPTTQWVVAATGSGNLELLNVTHKLRVPQSFEAHSSAVNFASFVNFKSSIDGKLILVSAGSDGNLSFFTVTMPKEEHFKQYADLTQRQTELQVRMSNTKKPSKVQHTLLNSLTSQLSQIQGAPSFSLISSVKLPNIINWCCTSSSLTKTGNLFIADTSNSISCYTIEIGLGRDFRFHIADS